MVTGEGDLPTTDLKAVTPLGQALLLVLVDFHLDLDVLGFSHQDLLLLRFLTLSNIAFHTLTENNITLVKWDNVSINLFHGIFYPHDPDIAICMCAKLPGLPGLPGVLMDVLSLETEYSVGRLNRTSL